LIYVNLWQEDWKISCPPKESTRPLGKRYALIWIKMRWGGPTAHRSCSNEPGLFFVLIAIDLAPGETLIKNMQGSTTPAIVASPLQDPYDDNDNADDGE
jgi:hypothetical protein